MSKIVEVGEGEKGVSRTGGSLEVREEVIADRQATSGACQRARITPESRFSVKTRTLTADSLRSPCIRQFDINPDIPAINRDPGRCNFHTHDRLRSLSPHPHSRNILTPMTQTTLVIASRNAKKSKEVQALLDAFGISSQDVLVKNVAEFDGVPEVIEDGVTFGENAAKKASQTAKHLGLWTIGEDSGLIVDALNGAPGIYSARFSGENASDESNNAKLIESLQDVPSQKRTAAYLCHIALSDPRGNIRLTSERTCKGIITTEPHGTGGFGYDPYFLIPEYHQTFGELPAIVKQYLSHRARAFANFLPQLMPLLKGERAGARS
jgi:XTP/dITP diphosphohydrolase